jgi:phosphatidylserine/phosphatidylglycerophosphate/cardiolipin synthase-like enzyme
MSLINFSLKKYLKYKRYFIKFIVIIFAIFLLFLLFSYLFKFIKLDGNVYMPKHEKRINEDFVAKLFFNDVMGYKDHSKIVFDTIESAEKSIKIAVYSIENLGIVEILERKKQEGINVEIIVPISKRGQHKHVFDSTSLKLLELGKNYSDSESDLMHHKFVLIDDDTENRNLLFSSSNLTVLQEKYDRNFLLKTSDEEMIKIFKHEFDLLSKQKHGVKKLFNKEYNPFSALFKYNNGFVELWFSPGYLKNSVKYRMLDLIKGAEENIKIIGWQVNDQDIYKALIQKIKQGVSVQIILDDYYDWGNNSIFNDMFLFKQNTQSKNITLHTDSYINILFEKEIVYKDPNLISDFNSFVHHHTLIIDNETLVAGTNNWGLNGFYFNDESVLITNVADLVSDYVQYFNFLDNLIAGEELNFFLTADNKIFFNDFMSYDAYKIIVYIEKSHPHKVGEICLEFLISEIDQINIPEKCLTPTTKFFLINKNFDLLGSGY